VRIEADDPTGDWTRAGVFEVDPGLYRIPLPLPHDGLRAVNVYALTSDHETVVVDAGWNLGVARSALEQSLAALDRSLGDIRRFLVTHAHRDHYGQAVVLRRELGMRVALGEGERPTIELLSDPGHRPLSEFEETLFRCGAHGLLDWIRALGADATHQPNEWPPPDDWLIGGEHLPAGGRTLTVIETPGHTRGHVVYVDDEAGLLLAGDHVLPHITPSIGFEPIPLELVLGRYLDSLRLVREMPDRRLLPAHGPVSPSVHARVDELIDHHARRLDECVAVLGTDELTAYECAQRLTWTRRHRSFTELDEFNQMLAVGEAGAHLDLAVAQGRLTATDPGGVRRYAHG
jgi:glyoxylase-like metal-dependent hydrolase (beta-lactamase superfamily II)